MKMAINFYVKWSVNSKIDSAILHFVNYSGYSTPVHCSLHNFYLSNYMPLLFMYVCYRVLCVSALLNSYVTNIKVMVCILRCPCNKLTSFDISISVNYIYFLKNPDTFVIDK